LPAERLDMSEKLPTVRPDAALKVLLDLQKKKQSQPKYWPTTGSVLGLFLGHQPTIF